MSDNIVFLNHYKDADDLRTRDIEAAKRTIETEIAGLRNMAEKIGFELTKALDLMQNTKGRIIVTGMGKPGHISKKIAATLASTGTPAFFVHPGEASHGDLGMITNDDVIIVISNSGESKELGDIINYSKRYNIPLIAITKVPNSTVGKQADLILRLPDSCEACPMGLAPTTSTTGMLVWGDILAVGLMERRGFTKMDYNKRHPGGKLGAILLKVSDLMHKDNELPLSLDNSTMKDALLTMSEKRLGCVGIVSEDDSLIGMITDGDLRRNMSDDMFSKKTADIMTKNPKVIAKDILAAEALNLMNEKKITQLFVVEKDKPVGLIHLHDLLQAGVA